MKIVIVGSSGHLGSALHREAARRSDFSGEIEVVPLDLPHCDVTSRLFTRDAVVHLKPDVIFNAVSIERIDWLETHPNTSRSVHVQGTANLREAAKRTGALLVHFSTSEVFGEATPEFREKGFSEHETPAPESVFAKNKFDAERAASEWEKHLIVRTSMLFGKTTERSSASVIDTILSAVMRTRHFQVLSDLYVSPSWTDHLAQAVFSLVEDSLRNKRYGLYHLANSGVVSYREIAETLARKTGLPLEISTLTLQEYGTKAPRTVFGALDCSRYHALPDVFPLPTWDKALDAYLDSRAVNGV